MCMGVGRCLPCPLGCSVVFLAPQAVVTLCGRAPCHPVVPPLSAWSKQARYWFSTGSHCCFFTGFPDCWFPIVTPCVSSDQHAAPPPLVFLTPGENIPLCRLGSLHQLLFLPRLAKAVGDHLPSASLVFASKTQFFEAKLLACRVLVQKGWSGEKKLLLWPSSLHGGAKRGAKRAESSSGKGDAFQAFCPPSIPALIPLQPHPAFLHLSLSASCPSTLIQIPTQTPTWVQIPPWPLWGQLQDTTPTWQPVPKLGHPPGVIHLVILITMP